jgi:uridine kinase
MLIIGIAGGSGSGKTTVVKHLIEQLPAGAVSVLSQDSYYLDNSMLSLDDRQKINFDHPHSIDFTLFCNHIKALKNGQSVNQPVYSFLTCTRQVETEEVKPTQLLIVEGILLFTCVELLSLLTLKVFVDAEPDDRLTRIIERDTLLRGRNLSEILARYHKTVKPMHQQFIEPSKRYADIIIPGGGFNHSGIEVLVELALRKLEKL